MTGRDRALLVSEVGWRGMKELSSALVKEGFLVDIIIRGAVDREILDIITRPDGLKIRAAPKRFFKLYIACYLLCHKIIGDLKKAIVSKKETVGWLNMFGVETKLLVEKPQGYSVE
ncbi:MAG: hypothetical protein HY589_03090 [Candidatus Omnitrophica bacterium]|nr:hypothetical protein [Candidatus Omnitrophota bacterium]